MLTPREQTPQGSDRRVRGIARGNAWPLYCDAMTDPDDKPSFLARLAIVVTIGAVALQLFFGILAMWMKMSNGKAPSEAAFIVGIFPTLSHFGVAGLCYLFGGKPTGANEVIFSRLSRVWIVSFIGGAIYFFLI
jgi:hypothetical protein